MQRCCGKQGAVGLAQRFAKASRLHPYIEYHHLILVLGQSGGTDQRAGPLQRKHGACAGAGKKKKDEECLL